MFQARSRSALILGREGLPRIKSTLMAGQPSCIKIKEYLIRSTPKWSNSTFSMAENGLAITTQSFTLLFVITPTN